eukprot:TRINITY_DN5498_c0_g1_i1.p1 TRINITY_DN5498_c0_g1~~TRINITY_DN5498_c0_g1_i1.p1  ORF type:complete len:132 (+),score=32.06 TRINITY_DN5498_c0_g1_i1:88-483(+)
MLRSLVGSEMCIRDSPHPHPTHPPILDSSAIAFVPSATATVFVPSNIPPAPEHLQECFLSGAELSREPADLIADLPSNLSTGPHPSLLHYLSAQYALLRYDAFCELHDRVHAMHCAQQGRSLSIKLSLIHI